MAGDVCREKSEGNFPREEPRKSGGRKPRRMFKMAE